MGEANGQSFVAARRCLLRQYDVLLECRGNRALATWWTDFGINVLWHPSLGLELGDNVKQLLQDCISGKIQLDIFVFEGTVVNAPNGTGNWNRFLRPADEGLGQGIVGRGAIRRRDRRLRDLGRHSGHGAEPFRIRRLAIFKARTRWPRSAPASRQKRVCRFINIPGCPAHPDWVTQILVAVASGRAGDLTLDEFHRPKTFFSSFTQTGCTRNMHFAYKVSATEFGQRKGCLFYDLGCPRPDDPQPLQPRAVEPAVVQDPRGHALHGLHRAGIPLLRSSIPARCSRRRPSWASRRTCRRASTRRGYIKLTGAAKAAAPAWAEQDIFVV